MVLVNKTLYMSDATLVIYGLEPDSNNLTYEDFFELVLEEDKHVVADILNDLPLDPFNAAVRIRRDGTIGYIHFLIEVILDNKSMPVMMHGTVQDMTDKKELQKEL